jgi:hypothetical protein
VVARLMRPPSMRVPGVFILVALISGCDPGEDSWALYRSDHIYNGGAPSISPDGQRVVFSLLESEASDVAVYLIRRDRVTLKWLGTSGLIHR